MPVLLLRELPQGGEAGNRSDATRGGRGRGEVSGMATHDAILSAPVGAPVDADEEPLELLTFEFTRDDGPAGLTRRTFVQALGAGLLIAVTCGSATAQDRGGGGG